MHFLKFNALKCNLNRKKRKFYYHLHNESHLRYTLMNNESHLKNDRGFIIREVDENEYRNYADYIDHQPKNFEPESQVFNINQKPLIIQLKI